ncbi:MAG: SDR family oxidoreductase [Candidatus Thermoplasmatota archaeon]|nr:SDR family oxidoreductase [Candidatus Thermoplasmatota archaeon]MBS3790226.1 SDR family oxidoreductase [Candidatus Thermoplasmatota archaeon]
MQLEDSVALVTGSSSGIGKETAIKFAEEGSKVVVTYNRGKERGEEVVEKCRKNSEAILVHLDVTDKDSVSDAVEAIIDKFGRIDLLINNAGISISGLLDEQSFKDIEKQLDVNLKGLIQTTKIVLPYLKKGERGMIINIASGLGKSGSSEVSIYCATKFGVRGLTQSIAEELSPEIGVYVVNPGMTATPMTDYKGEDPKNVAEVIMKTAREELGKRPGEDVDVYKQI